MRRLAVLGVLAVLGCDADVQQGTATDLASLLSKPRPIDLHLNELGHRDKFQVLPLVVGSHRMSAIRTSLIGSPTRFTWRGTLGAHGVVVISSSGGNAIGTIFDGTNTYRIRKMPGGGTRIERVLAPPRKIRESPYKHGSRPAKVTQDGPIRVLVAYTPNALATCGDIDTLAMQGVALTNEVATFSKIATSFALAGTHETDFDESGVGLTSVLDHFMGTTDTKMREIHTVRTDVRADLAILLVAPKANDYDGVAAQTTADYATAFAVVNCQSMLDYHVMAHEIGHLLGLNDDDDRPGQTTFDYGYGHFRDSKQAASCWRTVMSSGVDCACDCPLIPHWSNPNVRYPAIVGEPTGVAGKSDNAKVIEQTAGAISRFEPKP